MVPCSLLLVSHPIKIVDGLLISLLISLLFLRRFVHTKRLTSRKLRWHSLLATFAV